MALKHAELLEVIDLAAPPPEGHTGNISLIRTEHLQLVRLHLDAGQHIAPHHVAGEISLHCLSGSVEIEVPSHTFNLHAGQVVVIGGNEPHGLTAQQPAVVLLTLLHPENKEPA